MEKCRECDVIDELDEANEEAFVEIGRVFTKFVVCYVLYGKSCMV